MGIGDWREFYASLDIHPPKNPVPKPTAADLDRYEAAAGFRLPRSYREYIAVFGPGRLLTDWDIAGPWNGTLLGDLDRLGDLLREHEDGIGLGLYPIGERDRVRRLLYFARAYKDAYGWDLTEVCDPGESEYAVYQRTQDHRVVRVGESFREFVEFAVLEMLTLPGWDEAQHGTWRVFEPAPMEA